MESTENQVKNFISKCDELQNTQFILAPTKIADLLRTIASAPDILALFREYVSELDYFAAQDKYFRPVPEKEDRAELVLPEDRGERLAFIFCLLTDIDSGKLNFNMFLHVFFDEDDGYAPAFSRFCHTIISPLATDVADALCGSNAGTAAALSSKNKDVIRAEIVALCQNERQLLALYEGDEADTAAGKAMIEEYLAALREDRYRAAQALLLGYHYYALYIRLERTNVLKLLQLTEEL